MSSSTDKANYIGAANIPDNFWQADILAAESTGADPLLMAAIAQHETGFGALGAGREGYTLGYGYPAPGQGDPRFKGLTNQLKYAGRQAAGFFAGAPVTEASLKAFQDQSWKPGDQSWYKSVWDIYQGYKGGSTVIDASGSAATPDDTKVIAGGAAYYVTMVLIAIAGFFFFTKIWK